MHWPILILGGESWQANSLWIQGLASAFSVALVFPCSYAKKFRKSYKTLEKMRKRGRAVLGEKS